MAQGAIIGKQGDKPPMTGDLLSAYVAEYALQRRLLHVEFDRNSLGKSCPIRKA